MLVMARTILSALNVCRCPSTFPIRSQLQEVPTCLTTTTSTSPHHDTHTSTTVVACGPYYGNTGGGRHRYIQHQKELRFRTPIARSLQTTQLCSRLPGKCSSSWRPTRGSAGGTTAIPVFAAAHRLCTSGHM